jgi:antitoxin Phd
VSAAKRKQNTAQREPARKEKTWQVQTAKAHFSEVIRRARSEGPQIVTKQGKEDVVILPVEEYRKLTRRHKQPSSLVQFFAESPLADPALNLEREPDYGREIEL